MSDPVDPADQVYVAQAHAHKASPDTALPEKEAVVVSTVSSENDEGREPTLDEEKTLRRVAGKVKWTAYTVAFVELCERFSYYGTTAVCNSLLHPVAGKGSSLIHISRQLHPTAAS